MANRGAWHTGVGLVETRDVRRLEVSEQSTEGRWSRAWRVKRGRGRGRLNEGGDGDEGSDEEGG